jgi:apolipoprotein N-acyltransferase
VVAILSGILFSSSFEPIGAWFLAPIAYAIFLSTLRKGGNLYKKSFLFAFVGAFVTLWWAGKYVGIIPLIFLALLHGLFYLPLGLIGRYTKNYLWFIPALLLIEELRSLFPFGGFSWMRIAFSQADAIYSHVISIGGALFLSGWVLLISLAIMRRDRYSFLTLIFLVFAPSLLTNSYNENRNISFIGIQGNTPSVGIGFNDRAQAVFNLHLQKTLKASSSKADVIIWPENAIDVDPFFYENVANSIESLTKRLNTPLIAGAITRKNGTLENVSLMYNESGEVVSLYSKQFLTPFGEYIPFRPLARLVSPYVDDVTDFAPGDSSQLHKVKDLKLAPLICYELLSDSLVRYAATRSDAFVAQTNSATFAGTAESAQQLEITRLRAIEHSREIASISTIGISAHIDINGRIINQTDENVSASLTGRIRSNTHQTLADKIGGSAPLITLAIFAFLPLARRIVRSS